MLKIDFEKLDFENFKFLEPCKFTKYNNFLQDNHFGGKM